MSRVLDLKQGVAFYSKHLDCSLRTLVNTVCAGLPLSPIGVSLTRRSPKNYRPQSKLEKNHRIAPRTYTRNRVPSLDHLDLFDVVCPCLVIHQSCLFSAEIKSLGQERDINLQFTLRCLERPFASFRIMSMFKLIREISVADARNKSVERHTTGMMSGVLKVTTKSSVPFSEVCLPYPFITSSGTPFSSLWI